MSLWREVSVGIVVIHEGVEHVVRALKPAGKTLRVVLQPMSDDDSVAVAKIAIRVSPSDSVELPDGADAPDAAGDLIQNVLGGELLYEKSKETGQITCPPMDVTMVASHLRIIHGIELQGLPISGEDEMLRIHNELHAAPFHEPTYPHVHEEAA